MKRRIALALVALTAACSSADTADPVVTAEGDDSSRAPAFEQAPEVTGVALVPTCQVDSSVYAMVSDGDTWFIGGDFAQTTDVAGATFDQVGLSACSDSDGLLDGRVSLALEAGGVVRTLALTDQHLLVGGNFTVEGRDDRENFVALDRSTMDVVDWGPKRLPGGVQKIVVAPSGKVYVAGSFEAVDGVARPGIASFGPDGAFDFEFAPEITDGPIDGRPVVYAVDERDDGGVLLGGDFGLLNGVEVPGVGVVDASSGRITGAFLPDIVDTNPQDDRVQIRAIVADGPWTYLCGDWWTTEGRGDKEQQRNVGRFDSSGNADPSFEPWTDGGIRDCELFAGGLVIGGHFDTVSGQATQKLALLSLVDGAVTPLVSANSNKGVQTITGIDDALGIGGTFTRIGRQDLTGFAVIEIAT